MLDADLWTGADQWSIICWPQNYIERHSVHFYPFWEIPLSKNINHSWASKIHWLKDLVQRVPEMVDSLNQKRRTWLIFLIFSNFLVMSLKTKPFRLFFFEACQQRNMSFRAGSGPGWRSSLQFARWNTARSDLASFITDLWLSPSGFLKLWQKKRSTSASICEMKHCWVENSQVSLLYNGPLIAP